MLVLNGQPRTPVAPVPPGADDAAVRQDSTGFDRIRQDSPPLGALPPGSHSDPLGPTRTHSDPLGPTADIPLLLGNRHCPGDVMMMTACLESLHRQFPGRYQTDVATTTDAIFEHNPLVTRLDRSRPDLVRLDLAYPLVDRSNQEPRHFLEGYCQFLARELGIPLRLDVNRPYLYLSDQEKGWMGQVQEIAGRRIPYLIVNPGGKKCYTTKILPFRLYQGIVDGLRGQIQCVQIGRSDHLHPRALDGAIDLRDKTDTRQLIRLVYHSVGGVGPSTFLQHLCAAFQKPYFLLDSAREPASWMSYPTQISFVRHGRLECCRTAACWATRTRPLGDPDDAKKTMCKRPFFDDGQWYPSCGALIPTEEVVRAVRDCMAGGVIKLET